MSNFGITPDLVNGAAKARGDKPLPGGVIEEALERIGAGIVDAESYPTGVPSLKSVYDIARDLALGEPDSQDPENGYVCGYVLKYEDRVEGQMLHRGEQEACQRVADLLPAVAVSGETPLEARMFVLPETEWNEFWAES